MQGQGAFLGDNEAPHLSQHVRTEGSPGLAELALPGHFLVFKLAACRSLVREAARLSRSMTWLPSH